MSLTWNESDFSKSLGDWRRCTLNVRTDPPLWASVVANTTGILWDKDYCPRETSMLHVLIITFECNSWKVKLLCHGRPFQHTEVVYVRNMIKTNINVRKGRFRSMISFDALTYVMYWSSYCPYHCFLSGDDFCFRASAFFLIICHWLTWLP